MFSKTKNKYNYMPDLNSTYEVHCISEDFKKEIIFRLKIGAFEALQFFYDKKMRDYEETKTPLKYSNWLKIYFFYIITNIFNFLSQRNSILYVIYQFDDDDYEDLINIYPGDNKKNATKFNCIQYVKEFLEPYKGKNETEEFLEYKHIIKLYQTGQRFLDFLSFKTLDFNQFVFSHTKLILTTTFGSLFLLYDIGNSTVPSKITIDYYTELENCSIWLNTKSNCMIDTRDKKYIFKMSKQSVNSLISFLNYGLIELHNLSAEYEIEIITILPNYRSVRFNFYTFSTNIIEHHNKSRNKHECEFENSKLKLYVPKI